MGRIKNAAVLYTAAFILIPTLVMFVFVSSGVLAYTGYNSVLPFQGVPTAIASVSRTVSSNHPTTESVSLAIPEAQAGEDEKLKELWDDKISSLKGDLLQELAKDCETKDVKEPYAAVILDTNNQMSFGPHMWQIDSVQRYVKKFYHQAIDRRTAILIALDAYPQIPLYELSEKVAFDEAVINGRGGIYNWKNCAVKLSLQDKIKWIHKLEVK
jgi:hypothetical protein